MDDTLDRKLARLAKSNPGRLLAQLRAEETTVLQELVSHLIDEVRQIDIVDVWDQDQSASTYWVLLMSGVDQPDEVASAKELLLWSSFFAKHSARVVCIQSSERALFKFCTRYFRVNNWPTLIFSDRPDMVPSISLDGQLLSHLSDSRGGIRKLLTELHALVESGKTIQEIANMLTTEKFWKHLKLVYSEVKNLLSVTVKAGATDIEIKK